MNWYLSLVFVVGASVGSFLNVVIDRVPAGKDIISKRSFCDKCKKTLAWYDLVPIVSWLVLRGRCRYCREPISPQYPIVEGATALLFVFVSSKFLPFNSANSALTLSHYLTLFYYLFSISVLIVIFVIDLKRQIIPNKISYFAIFVSLIYLLILGLLQTQVTRSLTAQIAPSLVSTQLQTILFAKINTIAAAAVAAAAFFAIVYVSNEKALGGGDAKLVLFIGLLVGWPLILVAIFLSFILGAIVGLNLILLNLRKFGQRIAFGPFMCVAAIITLFWGEKLFFWYSLVLGFK